MIRASNDSCISVDICQGWDHNKDRIVIEQCTKARDVIKGLNGSFKAAGRIYMIYIKGIPSVCANEGILERSRMALQAISNHHSFSTITRHWQRPVGVCVHIYILDSYGGIDAGKR